MAHQTTRAKLEAIRQRLQLTVRELNDTRTLGLETTVALLEALGILAEAIDDVEDRLDTIDVEDSLDP